ncbi:MAG TPA: HAD-IC family P-type ATPase, partial [Chitinophagaceae bacterium]|nr:HAD-IC family P-type ATPase [Chitinophagaceae bacterium]
MEHHHHHRHSPQTADQDKLEKDPGIHRHVSKGRKEKSHVHSDDGGQQHDKHAGHHTADFLKRFWICLGLTIPVLLLSHMIQQWLGFSFSFKGEQYLLLGLGTIIYAYGGWPFISGMSREIKFRAIGMMTLVALAISVAYIYSVAVVFGLQGMDFFWELATLIDIMLLGHWLEMRSQSAASRALESLVELLPAVVHIEKNGEVVDASLKELKNEDIILVKPGEKIPADGMVLEGHSSVNESMLTGESFPVAKEKDTKLIAGSVNGDGILRVRVTGTGKDSYLDKVIAMVQSAQQAKSKTQNLADRVAKWLTIISISIGILTFGYWYWVETNLAFALERMVTVMVTACPHALGVAIPLVVAISTSLSARSGLLIRNRTAFENARKLSTIIFDKTGTLTRGSHEVQKIISVNGDYSTDELLQYVAAVQQYSEHHIAKGIMKKIKDSQLPLWESKDFSYRQGVGVSGLVKGKKVMAAGPNFYSSMGKPLP